MSTEPIYVVMADDTPTPGTQGIVVGGFVSRQEAIERCQTLNDVSSKYAKRLYYWVLETNGRGDCGVIYDHGGPRP